MGDGAALTASFASATFGRIDVLVYSQAAPGAADADDPQLDEQHWSYMDGFAAGIIARGPTLAPDRITWTGSVHVLELASAAAAGAFVEREPYNRAGLFRSHVVRRFENLLGRTMWDVDRTGEPLYLVLGHLRDEQTRAAPLAVPATVRDRLILHGDLFTVDTGAAAGFALALEAPTRQSVDDLIGHALAGSAARFDLEILDWEFGGRR